MNKLHLAASFLTESLDEALLLEDVNSKATKKSKVELTQSLQSKTSRKYGIDITKAATAANDAVEAGTNQRTWIQALEYRFREEVLHPSGIDTRLTDYQKFEPGLLRIALSDCGWPACGGENIKIKKLAAINAILYNNHKDEYDMMLPNETYSTLVRKFAAEIPDELKRQEERRAAQGAENQENDAHQTPDHVLNVDPAFRNIHLNVNDYDIQSIDTYEQSHAMNQWTGPGPWCLTGSEATFRSYKSNGTRLYFAVKHGYRNIGTAEGNAYDRYGLSAMCIQIAISGNLVYCTSRYNHHCTAQATDGRRGTDNIFTADELCHVFGINSLHELFPPYSKEDCQRLGIVTTNLNSIKDAIKNTKSNAEVRKVFEDNDFEIREENGIITARKVIPGGTATIYYANGKILGNKIYNRGMTFEENYCIGRVGDGHYEIIDKTGRVVNNFIASDIAYTDQGYYNPSKGDNMPYVIIYFANGKCNVFNLRSGQFLFNKVFDKIPKGMYCNGNFVVVENNKFNIVNKHGKLLFNNPDLVSVFVSPSNYWIGINSHGKYVIINLTNKTITTTEHEQAIIPNFNGSLNYSYGNATDASRFNKNGICKLLTKRNGYNKVILINTNGEKTCPQEWPARDAYQIGYKLWSYDSYKTQNGIDAYMIPLSDGNRTKYTVVNSRGQSLLPRNLAYANLTLAYNCALACIGNTYRVFDIIERRELFNAKSKLYTLSSSDSGRYQYFKGYNLDPNLNCIFDLLKREWVIEPTNELKEVRGNSIATMNVLSKGIVAPEYADRYIIVSLINKTFGIYDIEQHEYILKDNTIKNISASVTNSDTVLLVTFKGRGRTPERYNLFSLETGEMLFDTPFDRFNKTFNSNGIATITQNGEEILIDEVGNIIDEADLDEHKKVKKQINQLYENANYLIG